MTPDDDVTETLIKALGSLTAPNRQLEVLQPQIPSAAATAMRSAGAVNPTLPPALVTAIQVASKSSRSFDDAASDASTGANLTVSTSSGMRSSGTGRTAAAASPSRDTGRQ
jgi:hypothetical protein